MAANDLSVEQIYIILNDIYTQATGQSAINGVDTKDFVTVATTTLKTGYDVTLNAISQVLSETIFSVRPYTAKFKGLQVSGQRWGNHTRKLNMVDKPFEANGEYSITDGVSYSPYTVNLPKVLQTNFYGQDTFKKSLTVMDNQLNVAFQDASELGNFVSMTMTNISDMLEQARENLARAAIANFIGGKAAANNGQIHLLTEYNAATGLSLTGTTVRQPANFVPFMKWVYARIKTLALMMSERSTQYHINVTGSEISRHTPPDKLKLYMLASEINDVDASVLSGAFNDEYLKLVDYEPVSYWQSIQSPDEIEVAASWMKADGTIDTQATAVNVDDILGVMFDEDAIGINFFDQATTTDRNGAYRFTNWTFFENQRYWNDFTENGLVLYID